MRRSPACGTGRVVIGTTGGPLGPIIALARRSDRLPVMAGAARATLRFTDRSRSRRELSGPMDSANHRVRMVPAAVYERLIERFPALRSIPEVLLDEVLRSGQLHKVPKGAVLFDVHSPCRGFPMLLSGSIRVSRRGAQGRELELYWVEPGDSCVVTVSCLMGRQAYHATGVAEQPSELFVVPSAIFAKLVERDNGFRDYVFSLFGVRLAEIMDLVDAVAFHRLDQRLAALLLAEGATMNATQQQLADRLGSVREIVGRVLRSFERRGLVGLAREQVRVLNPDGLRRTAEGSTDAPA